MAEQIVVYGDWSEAVQDFYEQCATELTTLEKVEGPESLMQKIIARAKQMQLEGIEFEKPCVEVLRWALDDLYEIGFLKRPAKPAPTQEQIRKRERQVEVERQTEFVEFWNSHTLEDSKRRAKHDDYFNLWMQTQQCREVAPRTEGDHPVHAQPTVQQDYYASLNAGREPQTPKQKDWGKATVEEVLKMSNGMFAALLTSEPVFRARIEQLEQTKQLPSGLAETKYGAGRRG